MKRGSGKLVAPDPGMRKTQVMSGEYERVLAEWALSRLPKDLGAVRVVNADVQYYEGFGGSDVTPPDSPTLEIKIWYATATGDVRTYWLCGSNEANAVDLGKLLRELFRIAEATSAP